jgi:transposase
MGSLSRQGSPVLRWALYEAALAASRKSSPDHAYYVRVKDRRGDDGGIALQSVARKMIRRSFHIMRKLDAEAWPTAA